MILLISMAIVPFVQAVPTQTSQNFEKIKERVLAEAPKLEDSFPQIGQFASNDNDDGLIPIPDSFPLPTESKTKEEILRLQCFPGYFTPNQQVESELFDVNYQIPTIVIIDDEMLQYYVMMYGWGAHWLGCCMWAYNILDGGDDYLESPYDIDFEMAGAWETSFYYWESPGGVYYDGPDGLLEQIDDCPPEWGGADVMILMSGQYGGPGDNGGEIIGLANGMFYHGGQHFVINACYPWQSASNTFQHEASHLFDCSDHDEPGDLTYCIMSYTYVAVYNGYCTGCDTQLSLNSGRFN